MRVIALLATFNEERFIAGCLEHLFAQGAQVYLLDNESTDRTVEIASKYLNDGILGIETLQRNATFSLLTQLKRKEVLAAELDADWIMHVDADEQHIAPARLGILAEAFATVERQGYNAVDFCEYTFIPTMEAPDHNHSEFRKTMQWYYPFRKSNRWNVRAWKKQKDGVDLASSGGHRVEFPDVNLYPEMFAAKHYIVLSKEHAITKYTRRDFDEVDLRLGWHASRHRLTEDMFVFPSEKTLRKFEGDDTLDHSDPWQQHFWDKQN